MLPTTDPLKALEGKLWRETTVFTLFLLLSCGFYSGMIFPVGSLEWLSQTLVGTSGILFSVSLGLSSLHFYFPATFGKKVIYRKYLGLMGYFVALIDLSLLLMVQRDYYVFGLMEHMLTPDVLLGGSAMLIFTFMALISNQGASRFLGPRRWKQCLRLGYVALLLLVLRAFVLEGTAWVVWSLNPNGLPPIRFWISLLALSVLFARLSLVFHAWWYQRKEQGV